MVVRSKLPATTSRRRTDVVSIHKTIPVGCSTVKGEASHVTTVVMRMRGNVWRRSVLSSNQCRWLDVRMYVTNTRLTPMSTNFDKSSLNISSCGFTVVLTGMINLTVSC